MNTGVSHSVILSDLLLNLLVDDLPGHDVDGVLGVREAHPGQIRVDGAGEALASHLRSLCGLRPGPQREMFLQGWENLLQGGLLQVRLEIYGFLLL